MGLDEEGYSTVRSHVLSIDPFPNLNCAYAIVVQQDHPMSFTIWASGRNSGRDKDKTSICSHCNREDHEVESYFRLIGYPKRSRNRPHGNSSVHDDIQKRGNGGGCNKGGAIHAHAAQVLNALNDKQWAALLGMLNSHHNTNERLTVHTCKLSSGGTFEFWYKRMGHPVKQMRKVFFSSNNKATKCFDLIHYDLWGPYMIPASCGALYFLTIVDDCSWAVWIYLLNKVIAIIKSQIEKNVKVIKSDNGSEFVYLNQYFEDLKILYQTSCVGKPQ
ncbi:hypothetical protein MANES_09G081636v8 [Manihot esculenta]|uniref:Uncharacterized protein n=1 Tax=Manihot esculenta TaxID=3983 RepID=A0ACB7H754_MANES|nr:hypothetical protein MANES_09G081636v8 [Manihot esculenta]